MTNLVLEPVAGGAGLYRGTTTAAVTLYYQSLSSATLGDTPDPATLWESDEGCWFCAPSTVSIAEPSTLRTRLTGALDNLRPEARWFAWLADPNGSADSLRAAMGTTGRHTHVVSILKSSNYQVTENTAAPFGDVAFEVPTQSTVVFDPDTQSLVFKEPRTAFSLKQATRVLPIGSTTISIPLTGDAVGTLSYTGSVLEGDLYSLFQTESTFGASPGPEFLYTYGTDHTQVRYPFFMGQNSQSGPPMHLAPRFDPLNPRDATRTNISLDVAAYGADQRTSDFFFTPVGNALTLTPEAGSGFALGGRYDDSGSTTGDFVAYLTPGGTYGISAGSHRSSNGLMQVMCGLWGTEFLLANEGDLVEFSALGAASADGYDPSSANPTSTALTTPYDTAYVRLLPGSTAWPNSGDIKQSYCVLAVNSVYFNCSAGGTFPTAIGCRIADLSDPTTTVPFPMVPYGAVYKPDVNGDIVDGEHQATVLQSLETEVLAPARRSKMHGDTVLGPIFFDLATNVALAGGSVRTGTGLIVDLNGGQDAPDHPGTWKQLALAKSPVDGKQMAFDASDVTDAKVPKVVSPHLSNALVDGAPFLVVGKAGAEPTANGGRTPLGGFQNELQLGEFTFKVDVGDQFGVENSGAIIIFKYSSHASVLDLYTQAVKWTAAETFVGDDAAVTALQDRIRMNFVASGLLPPSKDGDPAPPSQDDKSLYVDFNSKMSSKAWTGMVVLECPLDYALLPIDLQVLLGGIKDGKPLNAHHFGVTSNQIKPGDETNPCAIDQSSLFGLVHHDEVVQKPTHDTDFQLLKLNALYVNSALAHFDSRIAVSVEALFEDPTTLVANPDAPNDKPTWGTVAIDGTYQKRGTSGVVSFTTDTPRQFTYSKSRLRALDEVLAQSIALIPIRRTPANPAAGDAVTIDATIGIAGELGFRSDITSTQEVDVFSYDVPSTSEHGVAFSAYNLAMTTNIPAASTQTLPSLSYPIATDLSATALDATNASTRADSLVATYPLKLTGLRYAQDGMTPASIGGKAVGIEATSGGADLASAAPVFALEMKMIMGTAGALQSDKTPLEGALLLGWKPGGTDEVDDGFGVLFAPPAAMGQGDSLALEGSLNTVFGDMTLSKLDVGECGANENDEQFVLNIADVVFWILGLPFGVTGASRKSLTMFGDPKSVGTGETRLAWFMGVPGTSGDTKMTSGFSFSPVLGFMSGLKVNTDLTSTAPLSTSLSQLTTVTNLGTKEVIDSICSGKEISETSVTYDPSAGLLFFLDLNLTPLGITVQALFADPTFYGGRIAFAAPADAKNLAPFLKVLSGLSIEFDYRKVSDSLGVYSFYVQFSRKDKEDEDGEEQPIIQLGEAQIVLPSVGVNIWTNGDWKVAVGWPFSSTKSYGNGQQLKVFFQAGIFPLELQAGFYAANLHPQDVPAVFGGCPFGLIKMGGAGLSFGLGKEMKWGPVSGLLELYGTLVVQAMTAAEITDSGSGGGVDYYWFDITIGITFHAEATLNLAIIKASLDLEAAIEVAIAAETSHKTVVEVSAGLKVDLAVTIIFFTIHIRFTINVTILEETFGSGHDASTEGPTPKLVDGLCGGEEPQALGAGGGEAR